LRGKIGQSKPNRIPGTNIITVGMHAESIPALVLPCIALRRLTVCRDDVPVEYSGEEQAICAVGLAKPRPGVFVEAVQYLLVVCTIIEVR
jgi:hypothetical protein